MMKIPLPPELPTALINHLEELAVYYQQLKEYGEKISEIAEIHLGYVKALLFESEPEPQPEQKQEETESADTKNNKKGGRVR